MLLIVASLVPLAGALQTGLDGAGVHAEQVASHYEIAGKMEELLAKPFDSLDSAATAAGAPTVPTSYSDAPGTEPRQLVYLSRYDGDNADADNDPFTGVDDDLLWVRVETEETLLALETLTSR